MRRIGGILIVCALLSPVTGSAAPIAAKREQRADAFWMVPTGTKNHFIGYYAMAMLDEPNDGSYLFDSASVGKGRCTRKRDRDGVSISCLYRSWAGGKASETFSMDPAMNAAELSLREKGRDYHVSWTGEGFGWYQAFEGCMDEDDDEPREGQGGGLLRDATAEGHIFGEHLVSKGPFGAMLMSGAMLTECTEAKRLSSLQPGESITITFSR